VATLVQRDVDVILLDLNLPDDRGLASLQAIRQAAVDTPTVVLTGSDDEQLALSCIDAGAQDYLFKEELRQGSLRRTLSYAIARMRETQIRELRETLERFRSLTNSVQSLRATAMVRAEALRQRESDLFETLAEEYQGLLFAFLRQGGAASAKPRDLMEQIAVALGDASASPRDLIDLHVAALNRAVTGQTEPRARALASEGRLAALEMMGLLVDYYRTGLRPRPPGA
jgi:CheY-like chemotaxis protein